MSDNAARSTDIAPDGDEAGAVESVRAEAEEQRMADVVKALKTVYDPEIPADIYELGLIYRIDLEADGEVVIDIKHTAPGCPCAGERSVWV